MKLLLQLFYQWLMVTFRKFRSGSVAVAVVEEVVELSQDGIGSVPPGGSVASAGLSWLSDTPHCVWVTLEQGCMKPGAQQCRWVCAMVGVPVLGRR